MSIGRKSTKTPIEMNPNIIMPDETDYRAKMIYHRYLTGRSIIIDDLKYLWLKDRDGFEKLAKNIVEAKAGKDFRLEAYVRAVIEENKNSVDHIESIMNQERTEEIENSENIVSAENSLGTEYGIELPESFEDELAMVETTEDNPNIQDIMNTARDMIEQMPEMELMELLINLNETMELEKISNSMRYWNDSFSDRMVMYTVEENKKFNKLA